MHIPKDFKKILKELYKEDQDKDWERKKKEYCHMFDKPKDPFSFKANAMPVVSLVIGVIIGAVILLMRNQQ